MRQKVFPRGASKKLPTRCPTCGSGEDQECMVVCSVCRISAHAYCISLDMKPGAEAWKCSKCKDEEEGRGKAGKVENDGGRDEGMGTKENPFVLDDLIDPSDMVRATSSQSVPMVNMNSMVTAPRCEGKMRRSVSSSSTKKYNSVPVIKKAKKEPTLKSSFPTRKKKSSPAKTQTASKRPRRQKSYNSSYNSNFLNASQGTLDAMSPLMLQAANLSSMAEEKLLRQALENSKMTSKVKANLSDVPEAPIFYPTEREFADPINYIRKLHAIGERWGIVKVVPPKSWSPGFCIDPKKYSFATRLQHVHKLQEAQGFDEGKNYTLAEYQAMGRVFERAHLKDLGLPVPAKGAPESTVAKMERNREISALEKRYWQIVTTGRPQVVVEYGNDVDTAKNGSGFSKERKWRLGKGGGGWNLNRIAVLDDSPLRQLPKGVKGVTVPWVYCGMIFSSFCWHCEDNHLPSINYLHQGAPKMWYAAPPQKSRDLERAMKAHMPLLFHREPDLMQKLVTMLDPATLIAHGVPVCKATQREGTFIVTFPRGYHCGFNTGSNVAEAVNLAYHEWFPYGRLCVKRYREMHRVSVFPHEWLLLRFIEERLVMGKETDMMLKQELKAVFDEEDKLRKKAKKAGVEKVCLMKAPEGQKFEGGFFTPSEPSCKQCHMCHQHCYLSYMTCFCGNQSKVVCLHHIRYLCACKPSNKALFIRNINFKKALKPRCVMRG